MKSRKLLMAAVLFTLATSVMAIPAKRGQWRTVTFSDGNTVRVQLVGDELLHYWATADGQAYQLGTDGQATLITDLPSLKAKAQARRVSLNKARRERSLPRRAPIDGSIRYYTGTKKGIIILVQLADKQFATADNLALYKRIANEEGFSEGNFKGSVSDYFNAQSGGQFHLDFDVVGPITVSQNSSYYAGSEGTEKVYELVQEACKAADSQVNFADYDWDGDGEVDQVFIIYAGLGQANGGDTSTIWPHEWELSGADATITLDGVTINTYACGAELQPDDYDYNYFTGGITVNTTKIDGIGTICHEFSHCLGYPDMYDTSDSGENFGMGPWDLMDYGSYNDDGYQPSGYTSYEKMIAGWLTPTELKDDDQSVTGMKALSEGGEAYIIYNAANNNEYYLLENRQLTGWDASQYGAGLLVLHVDYDADAWTNNTVNNESSRQRMTIVPADNSASLYDSEGYWSDDELAGDPFPYQGNDSLTNNSKPACTLYRTNSDGSKYMNRGIFDITQNSDGTVSFNYKAVSTSTSGNKGTTDPTGTVLLHETFDQCSGTGGNDNLWSGNIASGDFEPDLDGWDANNKYGADQCAKFGTNKKTGIAYSPTFTLNGEATFTMRVAPWGSDGKSIDVYLMKASATSYTSGTVIDSYTMTASQWNDFTATITGDGSTYRLAFVPSKRFFMDDVAVFIPESTGIRNVVTTTDRPHTGRIYSIDGRYLGNDLQRLPHGIYISDGKKVVR